MFGSGNNDDNVIKFKPTVSIISSRTAIKKTLRLLCGTPNLEQSCTFATTWYPMSSNVFRILLKYCFASPTVRPSTFSAMIVFGLITSATLKNSKNKSSILVTVFPSEYCLVFPKPSLWTVPSLARVPHILNAEQGGLPSSNSNSPSFSFVSSRKSLPDNSLISPSSIGVLG